MKLHVEDNYVTSNSKNQSAGFTIAASAKAFQILSSGIYQRKIEAIVRELSCNAYDSHVQAGWPERPFEITLPTDFDPEFVVEDFGIGLSPEDVESIYTTYFASTKTDSNDVIGALGLGSKTPFAYTDTFTIRARKDGVESFYNAHINAAGSPAVTRLAITPTDEPNGVRVAVPIRRADFDQFYRDATKVYSWFKVRPTFIGRAPHISDNITKIRDRLFTDGYVSTEGNDHVIAVMGNVAYDINNVVSMFGPNELPHDVATFLKNRMLYISFNIGDLDVQASRETISFGEQTKENFIIRLRGIIDKELFEVQRELYLMDSVFSQLRYIKKIFLGEWAYPLFKSHTGKALDEYIDVSAYEGLEAAVGKYAYDAEFAVKRPVLDENGVQLIDMQGQPVFRHSYEWPEQIQLYYGDCLARTSKRNSAVQKVQADSRVRRMTGDMLLTDVINEHLTPTVVFYYCDAEQVPHASYRAMYEHTSLLGRNVLIAIHVRNPVLGDKFRAIADLIGYDSVINVDLAKITIERNERLKAEARARAAEAKAARARAEIKQVKRAANTEFRGLVIRRDGSTFGNYTSTSGDSNLIDAQQFKGKEVILVSSLRNSHNQQWLNHSDVDKLRYQSHGLCVILNVDAIIIVKANQYHKTAKLLGDAIIDTDVQPLVDRITPELALLLENGRNSVKTGKVSFAAKDLITDAEKFLKSVYLNNGRSSVYSNIIESAAVNRIKGNSRLYSVYATANDLTSDSGVDLTLQNAYGSFTYSIRDKLAALVNDELNARRCEVLAEFIAAVRDILQKYPKLPLHSSVSSAAEYIRKQDALRFNKLTSVVEL